jgi:Zn finger protein HypA/HybF involved in hydrogenase expression
MGNEKLDLIDRNALIEKAYFHGKLPDPGCLYPDGKEAVDVDDIEDAPTVDAVEVVYGHMEEIEPYTIEVDRKCCLCGTSMTYADNYCPNCGAKMTEVSNE